MKTPVIGLLIILMMKREGEKEATATTTDTTMAATTATTSEEDRRELEKIRNEELEEDIEEERVEVIINILITELTNKPDAENLEEGLRILKNQKLKRKLKHTQEIKCKN